MFILQRQPIAHPRECIHESGLMTSTKDTVINVPREKAHRHPSHRTTTMIRDSHVTTISQDQSLLQVPAQMQTSMTENCQSTMPTKGQGSYTARLYSRKPLDRVISPERIHLKLPVLVCMNSLHNTVYEVLSYVSFKVSMFYVSFKVFMFYMSFKVFMFYVSFKVFMFYVLFIEHMFYVSFIVPVSFSLSKTTRL